MPTIHKNVLLLNKLILLLVKQNNHGHPNKKYILPPFLNHINQINIPTYSQLDQKCLQRDSSLLVRSSFLNYWHDRLQIHQQSKGALEQ